MPSSSSIDNTACKCCGMDVNFVENQAPAMLDKKTEALRQLLRQANELEQQMLELEQAFARVRQDFETAFEIDRAPAVKMPPRPHLHDPNVVDVAIRAMSEENASAQD